MDPVKQHCNPLSGYRVHLIFSARRLYVGEVDSSSEKSAGPHVRASKAPGLVYDAPSRSTFLDLIVLFLSVVSLIGTFAKSSNHMSCILVNSLGTLSRFRLVRGLSRHSSGRRASNFQKGILLPFMVTRPVTIQEESIAVEFRDANRVFEKALSKRRLHPSIYVP
jgi:hypothetical protein